MYGWVSLVNISLVLTMSGIGDCIAGEKRCAVMLQQYYLKWKLRADYGTATNHVTQNHVHGIKHSL